MRWGALTFELEYILGQPIAILEHGGAGPGANHQSIYHAHAHIVTTELNPIPILSSDFARRNVSHTSFAVADHSHIETVTTLASGANYLYAQSAGAALLTIDTDGTHPSQQIQRALGTQHYGTFLDWKQIGQDSDDALAKLSVQRMLSMIDRCRNGARKGRIL